jgi:hypothetical protein
MPCFWMLTYAKQCVKSSYIILRRNKLKFHMFISIGRSCKSDEYDTRGPHAKGTNVPIQAVEVS